MLILVKLFGIAIVAMGIYFLINPKAMKQYIAFWQPQRRLYIGSISSLLFGVIFLLAASQCRLSGIIIFLGIWALLKGVLLLVLGQKRLNTYLNWWLERPLSVIRLLGIIVLAFGALIIYSA